MSSNDDRFGMRWSMAAAALVLVSAVVGFLWLPAPQGGGSTNLWLTFCRAAGIPVAGGKADFRPVPAAIPSDVVWTPAMERVIDAGNASRGQALAGTCAGCHGANGISGTDQFPDLAGQSADALFKQLDDFHSGKRPNPIMQGMTATLSEQQMADLAAYFANLPPPPEVVSSPPRVVTVGDPARGLAPCAACHGPMGHKRGAPLLAGQKAAYLQAQLEAFAVGTRRNDINQQMREVARSLSAAEITELAQWYGRSATGAAKVAAAESPRLGLPSPGPAKRAP